MMNIIAWILQGLMAAMFLMAGAMKTFQNKAALQEKLGGWTEDLSLAAIRGIGIVEILGAVGLILPMLLNQYVFLAPLAAIGLALTMIGAGILHLKRKEFKDIGKNAALFVVLGIIVFARYSLMF